MASVNSILFDQPAYAPGDIVTATVNYTSDPGTVLSQTFTFTANVTDAAGNVVASNAADFVVDTAGAAETVSVSDTGGHAWTEGTPATQADGSISVDFQATV